MKYSKYIDKKKMSIMSIVLIVMPCILTAQGIQWVEAGSMDEIRAKAKAENKYIFMDCYTTWCKPCKEMDKDVFSNGTVGKYFQDKFIAIKVQMDKTKNDSKNVQAWYNTAKEIETKYNIGSFPTYIFLDPDGQIVQKSTSYQPLDTFLATAGMALIAGKKYDDPFYEYNEYRIAYNSGKRDYEKMPEMFLMAKQARDNEMYEKLGKEYLKYLESLSEEQWYTKNNIRFIADVISIKRSTNKYLKLFYPPSSRVDLIMNNLGYSTYILDSIIQKDIVRPAIKAANGKPNWNHLKDSIENLFSSDFANRNILFGKITTYKSPSRNPEETPIDILIDYYNVFREYMKTYGYGSSFINYGESILGPVCGRTGSFLGSINNLSYELYYRHNNIAPKEEYKKMIEWLKVGIADYIAKRKQIPELVTENYYVLIYKYAQKYMSGKEKDDAIRMAIEWAQITLVPNISKSKSKLVSENIEKMKRGEPYTTVQ